ncbi:UNVERIFIED_ORG: DUF1236 domain-containing protein (plasmid) [Roseateles sp. XES5]|nr:DUF1236 domain-containing protein [Roseateles sp. XES5]
MKTSIRRTLATLFLSGTTALAGPVFAQQADPLLLPQGQGQSEGSAQTEGGATGGSTAQSSSGSVTGETGTETTQTPTNDTTGKSNRQTTAEGGSGQAEENDATSGSAQSNTEGQTETQSTAGASTSGEADETTASAPSNETTASIDVTTEQRTEIHNVIVESDAKPVDIDIDVNIGTIVPRTVELRPLPPRIIEIVPAYRTYKYILLADGRILIIEPASLKIVYVITA